MDEQLVEQTRKRLQDQKFTNLISSPTTGLYLFFSFDLVNSTHFKNSHPADWPVVVTRFYEFVWEEFTTRLSSVILWKYVGDETLFYKKIVKKSDVYECLPAAYDALIAAIALIHSQYPATKKLLSIKATVWIAHAEYIPPGATEKAQLTERNIIVRTGRFPDSVDRDFLGPDIDTGFRISKLVQRRRLIVAANLAYLLYRDRSNCPLIEERLRIISYDILKGVWDGRHYPVIWYENDWKSVEDTFLYDEHLTSSVINKIRDGLEKPENKLSQIEKIFNDLGMKGEIESLYAAFQSVTDGEEDEPVEIEIPKSKYSEVHCVAVCFSPEGKALVAKRPPTKRRFPNLYEFGCGQLRLGETFAQCLTRSYREDFGINLKIPDDPIPIKTFKIEDAGEYRHIPGIIFVAEIDNASELEGKFVHEKHTNIKWINPEDFSSVSSDEFIPDVVDTLIIAHAAWDRFNKSRSTQ